MAVSPGKHSKPFVLVGKVCLVAILSLLPGRQALGQTVRFESLTSEQGLVNQQVMGVVQDTLGFMWFSTQDGLNRYDGYTFISYRPPASFDGFIYTIHEDREGAFWIGTRSQGLGWFDQKTGQFSMNRKGFTRPEALTRGTVYTIYEDRDGTLWIGSANGLYHYLYGHEAFVQHGYDDLNNLTVGPVYALLEDRDGILWVGTGRGLSRYDPATNRLTRYGPQASSADASDEAVLALYEDQAGRFWVGTRHGLYLVDRSTGRWTPASRRAAEAEELMQAAVTSIVEGPDETLWIATGGTVIRGGANSQGLYLYRPATGALQNYRHDPSDPRSLVHDDVYEIYKDRSGVLWVTTWEGVSVFAPLRWKFDHYRLPPDTLEGRVVAIYEDPDGILWVGTYGGGLRRFDRTTGAVKTYLHDPRNRYSISDNNIFAIQADSSGVLWIGTRNAGLNRFDPQTERFTRYRNILDDSTSLSNDYVLGVHIDSGGTIWVGTRDGGLNAFDPDTERFHRYMHDSTNVGSLSHNYVWPIYEDHTGALWVGTHGGGLNRLDRTTGRFTHYRHVANDTTSLSSDRIYAISEDADGTVWVGTMGGGLNKFNRDDETFTAYTEDHGLPSNIVAGILPAADGTLWMSTNNGLAHFDPVKQIFRVYDARDGLQSNEFSVGAFHQGRYGEMFFGGTNGLNVFDPDEVKQAVNRHRPQMVFTDVQLFKQSVEAYAPAWSVEEVVLEHDQNFVSIAFAALDYTDPAKNTYEYKLDGVNDEWVRAGSQRFADYPDLDPGRYTFRVRGANSDGAYNEEGIALRIRILPAWWQTWWFRFLLVPGLLVAMLAAAYRYRVGKLLEMERMRLRIAGDLHDDIGSNVSSIALLSEMLYDSAAFDEAERRRLLRINQTASETIGALREIIWFVDPDHDKLGDVIRKMRTVAADLLAGIPYTFEAPDQLPSRPLSMEFRRNVYLMYKEMLHNVVKHARASTVAIEIEHERGLFVLRVQDDGVGFDEQGVAQGHGLKSIRRRAERAGGTVEITSPAGQGTTVTFTKKMENGVKARWWFVARWRK